MGKGLILCLFIAFLSGSVVAQNHKSLIDYDQETYQLYLSENWKGLIETGQQALSADYDFYYLRMRMGLAFYHLQNYEVAREHLMRALKFEPNNHNAAYYLYYANILCGRIGEARRSLSIMNDGTRKAIKAPGKISLSHINGETGYFANQSFQEMKNSLPEGDYVTSYFLNTMTFTSLSGGINLGYSSNLMISVNRYDFKNTQMLRSYDELSEFSHNNNQNGYYLRYSFNLTDSWYGGLSYHKIKGNYNVDYYLEQEEGKYDFENFREVYQHEYYGAYFGSYFKYGNLSLNLSENRFWQGAYYQIGSNLYVYPFGNTKYYLGLGYHFMIPAEMQGENENVYKVSAGISVYQGLMIEGSYINGNMSNWADVGGLYLFNNKYPIQSRSGISISYRGIGSNLKFSLSGFIQNRTHNAEIYYSDGSVEPAPSNYSTTSIFGGLTWIF